MNEDTGLQLINRAIFTLKARHLTLAEESIFRGTWQGKTYAQMAAQCQYSLNYLMRDIGPKFWKLLSEAFGEEVTKTNLRVVLERRYLNGTEPLRTTPQVKETKAEIAVRPTQIRIQGGKRTKTQPSKDWGSSSEVSVVYGRTEELSKLKQWTSTDGCRLIMVRGMSGTGKTALLRKLVEDIEDEYDHIIWRNLSYSSTPKELVNDLLESLYYPVYRYKRDRLSQLIDYLRSLRCLLILDGAETIMAKGQLAGRYRRGYTDYGELLRRLGEESHKSCVLISSQENIREVDWKTAENGLIRSLMLSGLKETEARELFAEVGLIEEENLSALSHRYQGNPAALKIVAKLIQEVFNSNVAEFLERKIFVFGDIEELVASSFHRLSALEKEVSYCLAIWGDSVSLDTLEKSITFPMSTKKLLEVLVSLRGRSLLETHTENGLSRFALQPMMCEYITKQLVENICGPLAIEEAQRRQWNKTEDESIELTLSTTRGPVNLSQWLQNTFELGWEPLSLLYDTKPDCLALMLRRTFHLRSQQLKKRFKQIRLETSNQERELVLLVATRKADPKANAFVQIKQKFRIRVQLQPAGEETTLPANIKLSLLNQSKKTLLSVKSVPTENFIQLPPFSGLFQERFSIQIEFDGAKLVEDFVI